MTTTTPALPGRPAIVFDCDGVLVDSAECWRHSVALVAARFEVSEIWGIQPGMSTRQIAAALAYHRPDADAEQLEHALVGALVDSAHSLRILALPGAVELIATLRAAAIPLAVASNGPRPFLTAVLDAAGLLAAFDALVAYEDVPRSKPAPDLYLEACRRLTARPQEVTALEDSAIGIAAARAAGLRVVGVGPAAESEPVDLAVDSLLALGLTAFCLHHP